ncbi:MAG TPA: hypothetical protein VGB85_07800 [Nannocystis sp.]
MTWLSPAPRRLQRSRRVARGRLFRLPDLPDLLDLLVMALSVAQVLAPTSVHAMPMMPTMLAAPAVHAMQAPPPPCPEDPTATPPSEALALKNAAQEMRAAESYVKASRLFRDAVEELPDCATYADERLLWSLWAIETFDKAGVADESGELLHATEDAVTRIEASPNGRLMPDYPRLVAARDRMRDTAPRRPFMRAPRATNPNRAPLATRLGVGLMASGGPLVLAGTIVAGVYSARANRLTDRLAGGGGIYEQWAAAGCGPTAEAGEASACAGLRDARADIRREGVAVNRVVITSLVLVAIGSAIVLAGLGSYLHGRNTARRGHARVRMVPTFGGLSLSGSF